MCTEGTKYMGICTRNIDIIFTDCQLLLKTYPYLVKPKQVDEIVVVVLLPVDLDTNLMIKAMILAI